MFARRAARAGFFATVLLLGAVEWHPAGEPPHALALSAREIYFPSASHPSQPAHLEAATSAERPVCPACLHQLQTGGVHLRSVAALVPPAPEVAAAPLLSPLRPLDASRPSGARGPPSFS
jgi:hypothetical protein